MFRPATGVGQSASAASSQVTRISGLPGCASGPAAVKRQLSYKEKKEFEGLEADIAALTREKQEITEKLNNGAAPFDQLQAMSIRIGEIAQLLDDKELRWLELSELG